MQSPLDANTGFTPMPSLCVISNPPENVSIAFKIKQRKGEPMMGCEVTM